MWRRKRQLNTFMSSDVRTTHSCSTTAYFGAAARVQFTAAQAVCFTCRGRAATRANMSNHVPAERAECFHNVGVILSTGFQELHTELIRQALALIVSDAAFGGKVRLVANKQSANIAPDIFFNLLHPHAHVLKRCTVGDIVGDDDAMCTSVIAGRNGAEAFLSCSVPDLHLDSFAIHSLRADLEINANCRLQVVPVHIVGKAQEHVRLANPRVTNQKKLEETVVLCLRFWGGARLCCHHRCLPQ
mmetsp:Transcript_110059/g.218627  ORF Transcript_110059/g.218627 Transcript_110059/m.218627 type:complete len:244 (-) Transcript_110059:59-790(-)